MRFNNQTGSLTASGSIVEIDVSGMGAVSVDIRGTFVGTVSFEVTTDRINWEAADCFAHNTPETIVSSVTAPGLVKCDVAGLRGFRVRMSAYTSGTATINLAASDVGIGSSGAVGGGGGDASAANQATEITHLSAIETAVEAIQTAAAAIELATEATEIAAEAHTPHLSAIETALELTNSSISKLSAGTTEDKFEIKATAGVLKSVICRNYHATANAILKLCQLTAANTTPGTSTIWREFIIPASGGNNATGLNLAFTPALTGYIVLGKTAAAVDEVGADDVRCDIEFV